MIVSSLDTLQGLEISVADFSGDGSDKNGTSGLN